LDHPAKSVSRYALAHCFVDLSCAFLLFRILPDSPQRLLCFLLYNFCAFALQMPLGLLIDRLDRNAVVAALGCVLVAAAYGLALSPLAAAVVCGMGNSLFHLGGGVDVLHLSRKNSAPLGIFVSTGALGLWIGTQLGKGGTFSPFAPLCALVFCALLLTSSQWYYHKNWRSENTPLAFPTPSRSLIFCALSLLAVVILRSYVGFTLSFPWKGTLPLWAIQLVLAPVLGKALGGLLADRLGLLRVSVYSLLLCAGLFLFPHVPAAGVPGLLLFNMTMPLTLWAMARLFPDAPGFSFGLLTFGLFLGFLPTCLGWPPLFRSGPGFALAALLSLALLLPGLRKAVEQ